MKNIDILVLSSILGTTIVGSYVYYLSISSNSLIEKMWVGIEKQYRIIYGVMMVLATIGFLSLMYYALNNSIKEKQQFTILLMLILVPAIFWMGLTYHSLKKNNRSRDVSFVLLMTALGSIGMSLFLHKNKVDEMVQKLFALFTFHVTLLDGIIWNYKYINYVA